MLYDKRKVTAIIPAKNEGQGLRKIIAQVKKYAGTVIVIDGHSTDDTKRIAEKAGAKYFLDHGVGRGEAVRFGFTKVKTEAIILVDADGSHDLADMRALVEPILSKTADLVIASRRTGGSFDLEQTFAGLVRSVGADVLTYLVNHRFHTHLTDILYSYRAIRRSIIPHLGLTSNGFELEQEIIVSAIKKQYRVKEIPSREYARKWGTSKLHTITGVKLLFSLLKQLYME